MKKLFLFCLLFTVINSAAKAQFTPETDTLSNFPYVCQADSFTVTVAGMHYSSGYLLDSVSHTYRNDSLLINIYYSFQTGFTVLSPFQLPLRFGTPQPALYTIYSKRFTNGLFMGQGTSRIGICTAISGLPLKANDLNNLNIYPNPVQQILNIKIPGQAQGVTVQLSDLTGREILKRNFNKTEKLQLNLEKLPAGVYLLHLETEKSKTLRKIVKN